MGNVKKRKFTIGLHHGRLNPLPANFKFPSMTLQQLIVNYLLGDSGNNVPPYSSLSSNYFRHHKPDMKSLSMMKVLMKYVKKVMHPKGFWYDKGSDWSYERCTKLWNEISTSDEFKDVCNKNKRRKQLTWKSVYNVLSKNHVFDGRNKRSQVLRTSTLATLAAVADTAERITVLDSALPSFEPAASSTQPKSSPATLFKVSQRRQAHPKPASRSSRSKPNQKTTLPVTKAPTKKKVVIKKNAAGSLESTKCHFCGLMPTNHYCRAPRPGSMIFLQGQELREVCGMASCMVCREKWGPAEDFANRCLNCANESGNNLLTEIEI